MCSGMGAASGIVALISCVLAGGMIYYSVPVAQATAHVIQDPAYKAVTGVVNTVDKVMNMFGVKIDKDPIEYVEVIFGASAVSAVTGAVQLMVSVFLLLGSCFESRCPASFFAATSFLECVVYAGCWIASIQHFNMMDDSWPKLTPPEIQYWQFAMVANALFLLYACIQVTCFLCTVHKTGSSFGRRNGGLAYVTARTV